MKIRILWLWYGQLYMTYQPNQDQTKSTKTLTFVGIDEQGSIFEVVLEHSISKKWNDRLKEGRKYEFQKLQPFDSRKYMKLVDATYRLQFTSKTIVITRPNYDIKSVDLPPITSLVDMPAENSNLLRTIVVYVVDIRPLSIRNISKPEPRTLEYVEVYIIDQSLPTQAIVLTVFKEVYEKYKDIFGEGFTKPFVLTAMAIRLREFKERPVLQTTAFTRFMMGERANIIAKQLQTWIDENLKLKLLATSDLVNSDNILHIRSITNLVIIQDLLRNTPRTMPQDKEIYFSFDGVVLNIDTENNIHFNACSNCGRSAPCLKCDPNLPVVKRYKLCITVTDSRHNVTLTLFDKEAQELPYMQVDKALQIKSQMHGRQKFAKIVKASLGSAYTFTVKINSKTLPFIDRFGYTVHCIEWIPRRCKFTSRSAIKAEVSTKCVQETSTSSLNDIEAIYVEEGSSSGESFVDADSNDDEEM